MFWNLEKRKDPMVLEKKVTSGDSILPADFQIPDLSYLEKGEEPQSEMR